MGKEDIARYIVISGVTSKLSPLEDVINWIHGFTSQKYVKELIESKHKDVINLDNENRIQDITEYVKLGCQFIEQGQKGSKELAYLPLYYALLNIAKAYILFGNYANELREKKNRHHGAGYEHSDFVSLNDDSISIYKNGIIPLFYKTLVNERIPVKNKIVVKMKRIYPYIRQISAEYSVACPERERILIPFSVRLEDISADSTRIRAMFVGNNFDPEVECPKILTTPKAFVGMAQENESPLTYLSPIYRKGDNSIWNHVRRELLYDYDEYVRAPLVFIDISEEELLMSEEFPILCAFYHLSNLIRYNPKAMRNIMDSQYWPVVLALQRHGLYTYLLMFYRYVMQSSVFIT